MPTRPKAPCSYPGCPELTEAGQRYCPEHKRAESRRDNERRGSSRERGYTSTWEKARKRYLNANPLCARCKEEGITKAANIVDHIIPHKGNRELFWDEGNWQSLCKHHHDVKTATKDGGFGRGRGEQIPGTE